MPCIKQGQLDAAEPLYQSVLEVSPNEIDALLNYSTLHTQRGRLQQAELLSKRLTIAAPKLSYAFYAYANILHALKKFNEAADAYKKAITLDPKRTDYYHNEAVNHEAMDNRDAAIASYQRVMATSNASPLSFFNCGVLLLRNDKREEAIKAFDTTIARMPDYADAHINRTMALNGLYRFEEALQAGQAALKLNPASALAHNNRGNTLSALGQVSQALEHYTTANQLDHTYIDPYWNSAVNHLALGNFREGYRFYEWRWKTEAQKNLLQNFSVPLWLGKESLAGKTIYVYYEQGYGDFIQKLRFLPMLLATGARVLLETFAPLKSLVEASFPHENLFVITGERPLPAFDYHCPVMSLPLAFDITLETLPNRVPYLVTPEANIARWRELLGPKTKPRIGLAWSGAAHHKNDMNRSLSLEILKPLLAQPYEFHSLQKEIRESDRAYLGDIRTHENEINDFADTAALIGEMDLVLSVDTSVAHMAGAIAKPLWIMLPRYQVDYRWLLKREDSPWYPTARLFRQQLTEEWHSVVNRITEALPQQLSAK